MEELEEEMSQDCKMGQNIKLLELVVGTLENENSVKASVHQQNTMLTYSA